MEVEKTFADEFSLHRYEQADTVYMPYGKTSFPLLYLGEEEQKQIMGIQTDITTYVTQMEAKFITGAENLENFDAYVEQLEKMGLDEYLKIQQEAYDDWKATANS